MVRHGSFQRLTKLATGGMGVVYLGLHPEGRTLGAIKTMFRQHLRNPERVERFRKECVLHSRLTHPHVVACLESNAHEEEPSLVLEYLRGEPLRSRLGGKALPLWEVTELAESLASALLYLHARKLLHHDLKPSNVYVTWEGRYLLLDMGVAAETSVSLASSRTFLYSAPEVNLQQLPDPRSDLYSLGLVLFEALTGVRAIEASTLAGAIQEQANREIPDVREIAPTVPEELASLVAGLTRTEPRTRLSDAEQVLERLRPLRMELGKDPGSPFARTQRRGRVLALAARQEFDLALALLDALEAEDSADPWCPWLRARIQSGRGRFVDSLQHLREARDRGLEEARTLEHEGLCLLQAGRNLEAHGKFEELSGKAEKDPLAEGLMRWLEEN